MNLLELRFKGIRSFAEEAYFEFGKEPGVYFLYGSNEAEPELGANGVGKTTIWWALCWCLYGKAPSGLHAGALHTWNTEDKGYWAAVKVEVGGIEYVVARGWKPNYLRIDGRTVKQSEVNDLVGLSFNTFLRGVMIAQGGGTFFDLKPAAKLELFSEILQLERWHRYSDRARGRGDALAEDIVAYEKEDAFLEGKQDSIDTSETAHVAKEWAKERWRKVELYKGRCKTAQTSYRKAQKVADTFAALLEDTESQRDDTEALLSSAKDTLRKLSRHKSDSAARIAKASATVDWIQGKRERVTDLGGAECPTCGQGISQAFARQQARKLDKEIEAAELHAATARKKGASIDRRVRRKDTEIEGLEKELAELSNTLKTARARERDASNEARDWKGTSQRYAEKLKEWQKSVNPHLNLVTQQKAELASLKQKRKKLASKISTLQKQVEAAKFWVKGFKDIRLWMLNEALAQFEVETNNALSMLGLTDWLIKFYIERPTKSGKMSPGFVVYVQSPYNEELVPWEAWSGGESQRLRLAGAMGFMSLIAQRAGIECNVEVWDEPTTHLSKEGIGSLLQALDQRARALGRCVWLVDHHAISTGDFVKTATVVKTDSGSVLH